MNVVITGASRGIGKSIAAAYAAEGATLFLCARNELALYNVVAELQTKYPGATIKAKVADLSIKEEAQKFGQWVLGFGSPTIVVNNAGRFLPGNISTEEDGVLEHTIAANLYSAYNLTRTLVSKMIEAKQGHIFNICSIASLQAYKNGGSYSISKFALMGFSRNLREELKPFNIKVTSVFPGAVMTDSWAGFDNSAGRIMEADDIAKMIVAASKLSPQAVVEDIILRPQLGDL
jgi:short-subunit dehydrogenase